MIFQILLGAGLLLIVVYAFTQKAKSLLVSIVTMLCALTGLYFTVFPGQTNVVAHSIGIGRGADLILYLWLIISATILLNLHFKIRSNLELITSLARKIAIEEAEIKCRERHDG